MKKNYVTGTGELREQVQTALGDLGQTTPLSIRFFTGWKITKSPSTLNHSPVNFITLKVN